MRSQEHRQLLSKELRQQLDAQIGPGKGSAKGKEFGKKELAKKKTGRVKGDRENTTV